MEYGYFDDQAREYVITTPKTPVKWINYVGNLTFGGFVDQTGGLLLCKGDPALNRITKYLPQLPNSSFQGHALYLRYKEGGKFRTFSPFFVPTLDPYQEYRCHVGLGYTRIVSRMHGLKTEATFFVPLNEGVFLLDVKVTAEKGAKTGLDAVPVCEYSHFDALKQFTNADWVPQTMQSRARKTGPGGLLLGQYAFMHRDTKMNWFTANIPVSSFESDRRHFLGDNEFGTWAHPLALDQEDLGNHEANRGDNIGALLLKLGDLAEGKTVRFTVMLGQEANWDAAREKAEKYASPAQVDAALDRLAGYWKEYLARQVVKTPDPAMDSMLNVHNPRQCYMTKHWSRDLSLYQLGFGGRGIGFRDSSQDVMGVMSHMPEEAKDLMVKLLSVQKREGNAMHQFYASTMEANEGDAREREDRPKYYGDDHLWIVLAVTAYLKETGNLAFLDQKVPFYGKDAQGNPVEVATVAEHLRRAVEFTRKDTGRHGLPHLGFADWNDTVNLPTGAESLFNANLYGKALLELIDLAEHQGDAASAARYKEYWRTMAEAVNACAWDGEWYVRWFDAEGKAIGSHKNEQGKIWTNGQSWPVISGFAPPERAQAALDSVHKHLNTECGIKLSAPGYDGFDNKKGGVTTYPPGAKENGGIFLHANPWIMIAETLVGNGDRAYQYYRQINPAARNGEIDRFQCEPYVYPQNILGNEHPEFGLARNSWLSGTASWSYQAATRHILGLRPHYQGLEVDPCIPKAWDGFQVTREFRGATYAIEVRNPAHVCKGVKSITVDGKAQAGRYVPVFGDGRVHKVEVVLG
jgi:cellobiose phosphorylase